MTREEVEYLLKRIGQERRSAVQAQSRPARIAHDVMAEAYETRLRQDGIETLGWKY